MGSIIVILGVLSSGSCFSLIDKLDSVVLTSTEKVRLQPFSIQKPEKKSEKKLFSLKTLCSPKLARAVSGSEDPISICSNGGIVIEGTIPQLNKELGELSIRAQKPPRQFFNETIHYFVDGRLVFTQKISLVLQVEILQSSRLLDWSVFASKDKTVSFAEVSSRFRSVLPGSQLEVSVESIDGDLFAIEMKENDLQLRLLPNATSSSDFNAKVVVKDRTTGLSSRVISISVSSDVQSSFSKQINSMILKIFIILSSVFISGLALFFLRKSFNDFSFSKTEKDPEVPSSNQEDLEVSISYSIIHWNKRLALREKELEFFGKNFDFDVTDITGVRESESNDLENGFGKLSTIRKKSDCRFDWT